MRITKTVSVLTLAGALALTGCTSTHQTAAKQPSSAVPSTHATPVQAPVTAARSIPNSVPNQVAARKAVVMTGCAASSTGWRAGGDVTNSSKHAANYTITVFFTSPHATVLNYGRTTVSISSGATKHWSIDAALPGTKQARCVLRGVATA